MFIIYIDITLILAAHILMQREGLSSTRKQSVHNLLCSAQQTYEIMMWRLFTRRVRFIILAQRENKAISSCKWYI